MAGVENVPSSEDSGVNSSGSSTILDVARVAGVSKSVVSRVVSGRGAVSDSTRQRIDDAIVALGYSRNLHARALSSGRTGVVGTLLRSSKSAFYGEVFAALQTHAERTGRRVIAVTGNLDEGSEARALDTLIGLRVDGLIVGSGSLASELIVPAARVLPTVVIGRTADGARADVVKYDDVAAGHGVCGLLRSRGVRSAAMLVYAQSLTAVSRADGVRAAAASAGLVIEEVQGHYDFAPAYAAAAQALAGPNAPEAFIALSGSAGYGCVCAARDAGLRVPEDVAVVAADTGAADPRFIAELSGCRQDVSQLASRTWSLLERRMADPNATCSRELVPAPVVFGATV